MALPNCAGGTLRVSLKWKLVGIIAASWLLPVAMIICVAAYSFASNINRQVTDTLTTSVENATRICRDRMDFVVAASRAASYHPAIWNAYRQYLTDGDSVTLYSEVRQFLNREYEHDEEFRSVNLYFCIEPETIYFTYSLEQRYSESGARKYQQQVHRRVRELSETLGSGIAFLEDEGSVYLVRNLLDVSFRPYAVIVHELDEDTMFDGFRNILWATQSTLWVNGAPVSLLGSPMQRPQSLPEEGVRVERMDSGMQVSGTYQGGDYRLTYAVAIDPIALMNELTGFQDILLVLVLLSVPLLLLAVRFFYVDIARPVGGLLTGTRHIEQGELGYQIEAACGSREFAYLSEAFNTMSARLKAQFERIYSEELALRDARIMALQSQINPHFLNNTLEIVNWEARMAGDLKVSRMIEALSTMLDAALDRRGSPVVRLSEELVYVDAYLYIIRERLGKRLAVEKEIQPEALDCEVPRLVLQPIVENAIEHGIQARQQGTVRIRAWLEGEWLHLQTVNDGEMSPEDRAHVERLLDPAYDAAGERSGSLGIYNVNQRIKILYGAEAGLTVAPDGLGHVVATLRICRDRPHT